MSHEACLALLGSIETFTAKATKIADGDFRRDVDAAVVSVDTAEKYAALVRLASNAARRLVHQLGRSKQAPHVLTSAEHLRNLYKKALMSADYTQHYARIVHDSNFDQRVMPKMAASASQIMKWAQSRVWQGKIFAGFVFDLLDPIGSRLADSVNVAHSQVCCLSICCASDVTVDNVLSLIYSADRLNSVRFFQLLANFFFAHHKKIRKSQQWMQFVDRLPKMTTKILEAAFDCIEQSANSSPKPVLKLLP